MAVPIRGMAPLIQVFDMPTSLVFYCDVLGFELAQSAGPADDIGWVLLKLNGVELMLNTIYEKPQRPANPDPVRTSHHGDTALYFGCPDVEGLYALLQAKGIAAKAPSTTGYGWKAVDVDDPDGYHLCFHWPGE